MQSLLSPSGGGSSSAGETLMGFAAGETGANPCPCKLTLKQRVMGFGICFSIGMLLSILSTINITKPVTFASLYTLGNVTALFSTGFLVGPKRQCSNMFHRKRIIATLVYLCTLIATLACAITLGNKTGGTILVLFLVGVQFLALIWYTASYIPFARDALKKMVAGCFGGM